MDFNAIIDLIIKDLDEAQKIIDDLKKYPSVPALQVELAKSKCKSAGEVIALLKTMRDNMFLVKEELKKEVIPVEINPLPSVEMKESIKIRKRVAESNIIADNFSHLSNRFNEQLGVQKGEEDISAILKTKPLSSLSEAIGVNDRFLFIREIFDGNKDAYSQAILRLDRAVSLSDARAIIMSYTGDSDGNEAVVQLLDLIKRKLPSNE